MLCVTLLLWTVSMFYPTVCRRSSLDRPWRGVIRDELHFDQEPMLVLLAPWVFRAGTEEKVLLVAERNPGLTESIGVSLSVRDYPASTNSLFQDTIALNPENNYSVLQSIKINPSLLRPEDKETKYIQLVASFGQYGQVTHISKVSFLSGYIFIQTDKPVYNPGDIVRCRAFVSTPDFQAFDGTISVDVQNPDGTAVYTTSRVKAVDGIYSTTYALSDISRDGPWKVVASFDHWKENTFGTEFEVKKYVLPAFNATLIPKKAHLSLEDQQLEVEVYARYVYGEKVDGVAYVVFGVERNGQKIRISSMKQVNDLDGGTATLTMAEIRNTYPDVNALLGSSIYIKASVMTKSGSDLVEAEKSGIKIVLSPYVLSIKNAPWFFKAGLPLDLTVTASHHDGSPAPNVPVKISFLSGPVTTHSGTMHVSLNMPAQQQMTFIKAETLVPGLAQEKQARVSWTVEPYRSSNPDRVNLLHISTRSKLVRVGETVNFKLHANLFSQDERNYLQHVSYAVLSKGKIVRGGKLNVAGQDVSNFPLLVTAELLPSFRVVAYFLLPYRFAREVVADSVQVDVESQCVGSLKVEPARGDSRSSYSPGDSLRFQVRGDPGAKVSLIAVDNAIFLLSKSRLTQRKIWDTLGQGDTGCSPGGGMDGMGVFRDAGLSFTSSFGVSASGTQCHWKTRRRRSAERLQLHAQLKKTYSDQYLQRCCADGMREIPMPYSCRRRALYITEPWSCVLAFLHCCSQYRGEKLGVVTPPPLTTPEPPTPTTPAPTYSTSRFVMTHLFLESEVYRTFVRVSGNRNVKVLARTHGHREVSVVAQREDSHAEEDYYDEDLEDIYVRSKFFESWMWTDIKLPSVPESDGLAVAPVDTVLPDSITQWGILGVSASSKTGFCVADPFNVRAWKSFFVDLRLPRTAARNEHVEVKVVLHNYLIEKLQVLVVLAKTEDMCSAAFTEDHKQQVVVRARSSVLLPFTVIPLRAGELPLQVTALALDFMGQDAIRKTLRVVVEGVQKMDVRSFVLNPPEQAGSDGNQLIRVERARLDSVVPNSLPETFVNVRGSLLADSIDNSMSKDSLAALIRMPGGCVEQNLASITLPLIAAHYLDRSKQWEGVGMERREEAIKYIKRGYENQLNYRKPDDSYPPYLNEGSSTWITAFVVKVLSMAHHFIPVEKQHICGPLLYLLRSKQLSSGAFKEDNPVYSSSMTGGLQGAESRETLTAFVLIALAEAQRAVTCSDPEVNVELKFRRAGEYLKERYQHLIRPYSVAVACYALAVSNQGCMKNILLRSSSPDGSLWLDTGNQFFTLEASGYALLALLKGGHMEEAAAPFKWLNKQRRVGGGYGSTQSTMVVLQALSEYLVKKPPPADMNLQVALNVPGRSEVRWAFSPLIAHLARSSRVPLDQDFNVVSWGNGQGILEVVTVYNQLPDVHERVSCNGFHLNVTISESNEKAPADVEKVFTLSISVRALSERQVRMAVLDVSLPTGFEPDTEGLEQLTNSVDRYINNFQVVDNLSDRGSLIIHLFKVSNTDPDIIPVRLYQKFKVGLLQPSTVTVYQYYNKDKQCSRFYTPPEDKQQLSQICKGNVCRCTQGNCAETKSGDQPITAQSRRKAACGGIHHAFKVRVLNISTSQYDRYELQIVLVIKEGSEVGLKPGDTRVFLSHASCRSTLRLLEGQDYLIIGPDSDIWQSGSDKNGVTYTLGKESWVEFWPSASQCITGAARDTCQQLTAFTAELQDMGCQT